MFAGCTYAYLCVPIRKYVPLYAPILPVCIHTHLFGPMRTRTAPMLTYGQLYAPIRSRLHLFAYIRNYVYLCAPICTCVPPSALLATACIYAP